MFGLSLAEIGVIMVVALLVLGPGQLPTVMRTLARAYRQLARLRAELSRTVEDSLGPLDPGKWPRDLQDLAPRPKEARTDPPGGPARPLAGPDGPGPPPESEAGPGLDPGARHPGQDGLPS
ncbi:MAG: twin-arginine translocase TatA/TatE family subunit [Deltaproteobacteria bacterium]|jgi:sec-independent protein translocase protein TatB|nr:twin-arginine translocase TatA/TatE family subunit [Deltaproteobacteria bacterium]